MFRAIIWAIILLFACGFHLGSALAYDGSCQKKFDKQWTDSEKWVWMNLCQGKEADLDDRKHTGDLSNSNSAALDYNVISADFLERIVTDQKYQGLLPNQGLQIIHGKIHGTLNLENAELKTRIRIRSSEFDGDVLMSGMISSYGIDFENSKVAGKFDGNSMTVRRLELVGFGLKNMMDLTGAKISGYFVMKCANIQRDIWADFMSVDGFVLLDHALLGTRLMLRYGKFGADVRLHRSQLTLVDFSGSTVQGEILFDDNNQHSATCPESPRTLWNPSKISNEPQLILRNTTAASWRGRRDGWPQMDLDGFTYSRFQVDELGPVEDIGSWAKRWLAKNTTTSFQPYQQNADAMSKVGFSANANDVLFAGKERERVESSGLKYVEMSVARWLIGYGYGYRYFFALGWAALLVVIGLFVICASGENDGKADDDKLGVLYCIDMLLPLIQFRKKNFETEARLPLVRRYFYVHKLLGYILGAFILAGLSGITK